MEKKRVHLILDESVIHLARLEDANLSKIANNYLVEYFKSDNIDAIDEKIMDLKGKLKALEKMKHDLIQKGISTDRKNNMDKNIFNKLLEVFKKRIDNIGFHQANFEDWIHTPNNLERCKIIGKEPLEVLELLKKEVGIDA